MDKVYIDCNNTVTGGIIIVSIINRSHMAYTVFKKPLSIGDPTTYIKEKFSKNKLLWIK